MNLRPPFDIRQIVGQLLRLSDWAKLNWHELDLISSWIGIEDRPEKVAAEVRAHYGLLVLCVTLGARGGDDVGCRRHASAAGYQVPVVDTIGCGDAFLAALLAETVRGANAADSLRTACAAAALAATHAGASKAITRGALQALIETAG